MSLSKRKLAANRANAQKSTGPKTPEGRQTVSLNRVQHGLCGRFRVLASENQADYNDLIERFMKAEQPVDDVERELVAKMARHTWLSERALRFQEACFLLHPQTAEQQVADDLGSTRYSVGVMKDIHVYLRYQAANDRAYQRAANELAKRRKDRAQAERGFESQKRAQAEEVRREKRQTQRDELHSLRQMNAQLHNERVAQQVFKAAAGFQPPQPSQIIG